MRKKTKKVDIKKELHENTLDQVISEHAGRIVEENQLAYSDLVITSRAIPSQFDGMKPVHRRLFSSFKSNNLINKNIKSARIVGECLIKDTLISTDKGFVAIQDIEVGDQVYTQNGLKNVSALFIQPKQDLIKITLKGGVFLNTSTLKHKYKTIDEDGNFIFMEAENFKIGDELILEASHNNVKSVITAEESLELSYRMINEGLSEDLINILNKLSIQNLKDFMRGCYIYSLIKEHVFENKHYTLFNVVDISLIRKFAYLLFDRLGLYSIFDENLENLLVENFADNKKYITKEIESIEIVEAEETYDFTVDEEHEFFANCIVSSNCIGKLHPHGDVSVYDALIEMTQTFKNRTPLTVGQGNMGSISGDNQAAMRYCVTGDTLINTNLGLKRIQDLAIADENSEVELNINILSEGNKINTASKFFNSGEHDIYHLTTKDGYSIKGSFNHPLRILNKDEKGKPFYDWKMIKDIKKSDIILIDRNIKTDLYSNIKTEKNDLNIAIILGCLISEGSISDKRITFCNTDKEYFDDFINSWETVFGHMSNKVKHFYSYERKLLSGKIIYEFDIQLNTNNKSIFEHKIIRSLIGYKAKDKFIPDFILNHNLEVKKIFLSYLFEGDGSFSKTKTNSILLCYDSKSIKLIQEIQILLLEFGIYSKIREMKKGQFRLNINSFNNQNLFCQRISFSNIKKKKFELYMANLEKHILSEDFKAYSHSQDYIPYLSNFIKNECNSSSLKDLNIDRYNKIVKNYEKIIKKLSKEENSESLIEVFNQLFNDNYYYSEVQSVNVLPEKEIVYSIRVDSECHSFSANGFINHNTEIKLPSDSADMLFDNFEKDVCPTIPNYDDTIQEPSLLPVKFPLAILNGTTGVAYAGITSKIPSYNINELRNLYVYIIENELYKKALKPENREEIMKIIPTVDLPTGCNVYFEDENDSIFSSNFKFRMRATHHFEDDRTITFTKVPIDMTLDRIVEQAKNAGLSYKMVNGKKVNKTEDEILNISENVDIVSRSSFNDNDYKNDAEITFTFKRGSNLNLELIKIFKYTDLDSSYSAKLRFIDQDSCPVYLSLYEQSVKFLAFRLHVFYKAYLHDIEKLRHQLHMLYGLVAIYDDLDTFIHIVKNASDDQMYSLIKEKFDLDDSQIEYLLNIQLRKLSKTSVDNIKADIEQKEIKKADLETKIESEDSLYQVIKEDYMNMKFKRSERLTNIIEANRNISKEDMIEDKEVIVMYMEDDTIAYVEKSKFRLKNKGTKTTENKINNDFELNLKITESCKLKDELLLMTNLGRVFRIRAFEFGEQFRFIGNILNLSKDEKIINIMKNEESDFYSIITKGGKIKGISGDLFKNTTSNRAITVIKLEDKDSVIGFSPYNDEDMVLLLTNMGRVMKYPATEINVYGGAAKGTRAATLKNKEMIIKSFIFEETNNSILIGVSNTGKAKKTLTKKISIKNRTSAPNLFFNNSEDNGDLVCGEVLEENTDVLMLLTQRADISIIKTSGFNDVSRTAKGAITLIKMQEGEFIKLCKKIERDELSDTQNQIVVENEDLI